MGTWVSALGILLYGCFLISCNRAEPEIRNYHSLVEDSESITGRSEYLNSPFVTAGDRVYMVGHQNGQFPDLGWHVNGEMGGIWNHPIKLMDGFYARIITENNSYCLHSADTFVNYPFANKQIYISIIPGLRIERLQFVPDGREGLMVEYSFYNETSDDRQLEFEFTGYTDLRPVWLGERTGMVDGPDYVFPDDSPALWVARDSLNEWYTVFGSPAAERYREGVQSCEFTPAGSGCQASLIADFKIEANSSVSIPFVIAGSYQSLNQARESYKYIHENGTRLLLEKKRRYADLAGRSRLSIPDDRLGQAFRWVKYNTDWLVRDVPEMGRGLSAGLPDYPWWFGADNVYALQGAIVIGRADIVYSTIDLLYRVSEKENGNGRIVHEVSTNGSVYNPGNMNETPQFISLIWTVFKWTGDREFLQRYYPFVKKSLSWLLGEGDAGGNLVPDGSGMMEIQGLDSEMIDVAVYTQKAFKDASFIAIEMGEDSPGAEYDSIAGRLEELINTEFWAEEHKSFADFIGTTLQALQLIEDAIERAEDLDKPWAVEELETTRKKIMNDPPQAKKGFVLHHNWVVNTPMETGIAGRSKALAALETGSRFVNPFGVFVTGIDRDETAGQDESSFAAGKKVFSYTGAVMTLPTGVQAVAENNYGRPDKALDYLQRLTRTFSYALPGSIYEVSPDYGMMTQAWTLYSYAVPIVCQFFGIDPIASEKTIRIRPQMPDAWNEASLENVIIGENVLDLGYRKGPDSVELIIDQLREDWKIVVLFPIDKYRSWQLNGVELEPEENATNDFVEFQGRVNVVRLNNQGASSK